MVIKFECKISVYLLFNPESLVGIELKTSVEGVGLCTTEEASDNL